MAEMDIHGNRRRKTSPVGLWGLLNGVVVDFGNWIDDNSETIASILARIVGFTPCIGLLIWAIFVWVNKGFWQGVLTLMFACGIGVFVLAIAEYAAYVIIFGILAIRYVFKNIYTLLGTIAIATIITILF